MSISTHARTLVGAACLALALPGDAGAHGPVAPVASSYLATIGQAPRGLEAKVLDGDQLMWLRLTRAGTVVVLDYRGAPYLRFSASGVEVNQNSAMYFLNQAPVAETPPSNLTRDTPAAWRRVSDGRTYVWHDGRLHALATVAATPGATTVGRWAIPVLIDGQLSSISGELTHRGPPSLLWFWPIVVLLACVLAGWRLRRPALDARLARALAIGALLGIAVAGLARELHGRPTVSAFQLVELAAILAFAVSALTAVLRRRAGHFTLFAIVCVAAWEGIVLIPTLRDGFVLIALPAFAVRAATVLCLGCGAGLLLVGFRDTAAVSAGGSRGELGGDEPR